MFGHLQRMGSEPGTGWVGGIGGVPLSLMPPGSRRRHGPLASGHAALAPPTGHDLPKQLPQTPG